MTQPAVSIKRRLIALLYEALLAGAVGVPAMLLAGVAATLLNTVSYILASLAAMLIPLAVWWFYFKANWYQKGQTLPMKVWGIGLTDAAGARPPLRQLRLRFMWACVLIIFVPMLAYSALRHLGGIPPKPAFGAALAWWILPWGFALFNPQRQFLYDYLAGTRLVDVRGKRKIQNPQK
ncbi:RDD family protein [Neisseria musculi]|uniref:RDD family protein n=1 Tax=Neisseria musculi TaxID=1815583 RepID=A0A7H1MEM2_9NEIS|nr:RDD family protein [Neisseria musculi]QNT60087.1 RDD family protein [Neisseria musculi]